MRTWNRTAVIVVPKQPLLDWLHSVDPTSAEVTLKILREDPTVYLLAECGSDPEAETSSRNPAEQLDAWYRAPECWPEDRGIANFRRWSTCSFHSMVADLCNDPLLAEEG
jgi:hypothetical protein